MENCPVCKAQLQDPLLKECPKCGVIFEKWQAKVAAAVIALERSREPANKRSRWALRVGSIMVVTGGLSLMAIWPTDHGPSNTSMGLVSQESPVPPGEPTQEASATPTPSDPIQEGTPTASLTYP